MKAKSYLLILFTVVSVLIFAAAAVRPAQAAVFDDDGVIEAGETIDDDVFLSGQNVRVDGTVNGMLVAAGADVTINGTVNGDVIAMGQTITLAEGARVSGNFFAGGANVYINGQIDGSIAAGSTSLELSSPAAVERNIYYGGFELRAGQGSTVARGVYVGAYQAILDGTVDGDLNASVGALRLNGRVGGDAVVEVAPPGETPRFTPMMFGPTSFEFPEPIPSGVVIAEGAVIGGRLVYTSPARQEEAIAAQPAGGVVYQTPVPSETNPPAPDPGRAALTAFLNWLWRTVRTLVTLLLLGLLAAWLIPLVLNRVTAAMRTQPAESTGIGLLAFLGGYLAAFIAAVFILIVGIILAVVTLGGLARTIFGIGFSGLALVVTVFSLLVGYGSKLVVAYLIGDLLMASIAPTSTGRRYWAVVIGVILYTLVRSIPFLGWIIGAVVTLIGLGAMWLAWRNWRRERVIVVSPGAVD